MHSRDTHRIATVSAVGRIRQRVSEDNTFGCVTELLSGAVVCLPGIRDHSKNKLLDDYAAKLVQRPRDHTKRGRGKWTSSLDNQGHNQPSYECGAFFAEGHSKQRDWSG
jgi:hypothetical protein